MRQRQDGQSYLMRQKPSVLAVDVVIGPIVSGKALAAGSSVVGRMPRRGVARGCRSFNDKPEGDRVGYMGRGQPYRRVNAPKPGLYSLSSA